MFGCVMCRGRLEDVFIFEWTVLLWPLKTCANVGLCLLRELLLSLRKDLAGDCDSSSSDDGALIYIYIYFLSPHQ